jgi:hypothetical protein
MRFVSMRFINNERMRDVRVNVWRICRHSFRSHVGSLNVRIGFWLNFVHKVNAKMLEDNLFLLGSEVSTAVDMNSTIFWVIAPCGPLKVDRRFRETCYLHLQHRSISQQNSACYLDYVGFLFGLFFDTEDAGELLHRIARWLWTDYTALYPRR